MPPKNCPAAAEATLTKGVTFPEAFECEAAALQEEVGDHIPPFLVRRLLLDVGGYTEQRLAHQVTRHHPPPRCHAS